MSVAPGFSVVIPLHNQPQLILRSVGSVLAQSAAVQEIVIVDDGSTDDSAAAALALCQQHARVRLLPSLGQAQGAAAARNRGVRAARGEWVAFVDADDAWLPDHLAQVQAALASPEAPATLGAVFTGYQMVYPERRQDRRFPAPLNRRSVVSFDVFLSAWLRAQDCPIWTGAAAFRRTLLIEAGLFPEHCRRGEDKDLWLRAMARAPAMVCPEASALYYRDMPASLSSVAGTQGVPCILATLAALMEGAPPATAARLRRLHNAEVYLYAWMSWRRGLRPAAVEFHAARSPWLFAKLQLMRWVPRQRLQQLRGWLGRGRRALA